MTKLAILIQALLERGIFDKENIDLFIQKNEQSINKGLEFIFAPSFPINNRCSFIDFDEFIENIKIEEKGHDKYTPQKGIRKLIELFDAVGKGSANYLSNAYLKAVFSKLLFNASNLNKAQNISFNGQKNPVLCFSVSIKEMRDAIKSSGKNTLNDSTAVTQSSQIRTALYCAGLVKIEKYNENDLLYIPTRIINKLLLEQ